MTLMDKEQLTIEPIDRIGGVFPVNSITLVLALPGCGKTTTVLKALQADSIEPIWFNLDHSDTPADKEHIDMFGSEYLIPLLEGDIEDIEGRTVIIDTYERMEEIMEGRATDIDSPFTVKTIKQDIVNALESLSQSGTTVIVLAHPEDYVGRDGIFKDNVTLTRRAYEVISMEVKLSTSSKILGLGDGNEYFTYIKKGRAYDGERVIKNWMRES